METVQMINVKTPNSLTQYQSKEKEPYSMNQKTMDLKISVRKQFT